jgi:hypothetical protein
MIPFHTPMAPGVASRVQEYTNTTSSLLYSSYFKEDEGELDLF